MGYHNKAIGAAKGGLRCAECSASAEKSLLTDPKTAKNARRNAREPLENAIGIG
jgi:glutamate dehydrogenase/leucine dehydrogenase